MNLYRYNIIEIIYNILYYTYIRELKYNNVEKALVFI